MIRHTPTLSELRLFEAASPAPMAEYDAACLLLWETPQVVWIRMLKGHVSRKLLRELLQWLLDNQVHTVRAHRAAGHVLPLSVLQADGAFSVSVADLATRFLRRPAVG